MDKIKIDLSTVSSLNSTADSMSGLNASMDALDASIKNPDFLKPTSMDFTTANLRYADDELMKRVGVNREFILYLEHTVVKAVLKAPGEFHFWQFIVKAFARVSGGNKALIKMAQSLDPFVVDYIKAVEDYLVGAEILIRKKVAEKAAADINAEELEKLFAEEIEKKRIDFGIWKDGKPSKPPTVGIAGLLSGAARAAFVRTQTKLNAETQGKAATVMATEVTVQEIINMRAKWEQVFTKASTTADGQIKKGLLTISGDFRALTWSDFSVTNLRRLGALYALSDLQLDMGALIERVRELDKANGGVRDDDAVNNVINEEFGLPNGHSLKGMSRYKGKIILHLEEPWLCHKIMDKLADHYAALGYGSKIECLRVWYAFSLIKSFIRGAEIEILSGKTANHVAETVYSTYDYYRRSGTIPALEGLFLDVSVDYSLEHFVTNRPLEKISTSSTLQDLTMDLAKRVKVDILKVETEEASIIKKPPIRI